MCTANLLNEIYQPMKFQDNISYTLGVMLRTKIKCEIQQRAITLQCQGQGQRLLPNSRELIMGYLHTKFQVCTSGHS